MLETRLSAEEMIIMASRLLSGAIEQVLEEIGSPPFPDLEALEAVRDDLNSYIDEHGEALLSEEEE